MPVHKDLVDKCVQTAVENKATTVVNEYIKYWTPNKDASAYSIDRLDAIYYYLIYAHKQKSIDLFNYDTSIFSTLFLV
mgnify:CR=1 FL=1|jgi:hypothetical protein